jgi:thymidylate synthase
MTNILIEQFNSLEPSILNPNYSEIINFSIAFRYESINYYFDWEDKHYQEINQVLEYKDTERYNNYSFWWSKGLPKCTVELLKDNFSRRAIIQFLGNAYSPSCLSSLQFLIRNNKLNAIANFRSWELSDFGPYDVLLIKRFTGEMSRHLNNIEIEYLYFNAGSAHILT